MKFPSAEALASTYYAIIPGLCLVVLAILHAILELILGPFLSPVGPGAGG
jgi:hypothetical protein